MVDANKIRWQIALVNQPMPPMRDQLISMKIGYTKNLGIVVTRWSEDKWEVGTFGKTTVSLESALEILVSQ